MKVAVVGASGYTGLELLRIVLRHPGLELEAVTSEQRAGRVVGEAFPALRGLVTHPFEALDAPALCGRVEAAFVCLPHGKAARAVAALRKGGIRVVDLSADFRLQDPDVYRSWYGEHGAPELFGKAVYGLPEVHRDALARAELVAAPGCYPTASLLPLLPFLQAGWVEAAPIFVDAKSGVSGAGRNVDAAYLFAELDENARAYKVAAHRHTPEIEQEAGRAAGAPVGVTFTPHLLPTIRGIISAVYLRLRRGVSGADARELLEEAYGSAPFVRVLPEGETPCLAAVRGSNFCDVTAVVDERHGTLVALSALDNLVKGAGGQAVQCLNLMHGMEETAGLLEAPLAP